MVMVRMNRIMKVNKVSAILTSDWHLREDIPACWVADFQTLLWQTVDYISELQKKYRCPIIHAGDLFNNWKPSPYLLSKTLKHLPNDFYTIYGNHDLPQHNVDLAYKCGLNVLVEAGRVKIINGHHWGVDFDESQFIEIEGRKIHVAHVMTYVGRTPYPGCSDLPADRLLNKYKEFDLILTGHNHKHFSVHSGGKILVNAGGIIPSESDQIDYVPKIWLYDGIDNIVEPHVLPFFNSEMIQKPENIQRIEERNKRIDAFISKLNDNWEVDVNFEKNLERFFSVNSISKEVRDMVYSLIEK